MEDKILANESMGEEQPDLTFSVISDLHIGSEPSKFSMNLENAIQDLNEVNPTSEALCIVGDMTESGKDEEYTHVKSILQQSSTEQIYMILGNHDVRWLPGGYEEAYNRFVEQTQMKEVYYDKWIQGYHFIFLATSDDLKDEATLSQEQLDWLECQLKESHKDSPVFVFLHQSLLETSAGSYKVDSYNYLGYPDGVVEDKKLREVLACHSKVFLFTGHTHAVVDHPHTVININNIHYINTASVAYTIASEGYGEDNGSQGLCVEVYQDRVVIKGRDFMKKVWCQSWDIPLEK